MESHRAVTVQQAIGEFTRQPDVRPTIKTWLDILSTVPNNCAKQFNLQNEIHILRWPAHDPDLEPNGQKFHSVQAKDDHNMSSNWKSRPYRV